MQKYRRLILDLQETAKKAIDADWDDAFIATMCGLKMREAAAAFSKLLDYLEKQEDDRK